MAGFPDEVRFMGVLDWGCPHNKTLCGSDAGWFGAPASQSAVIIRRDLFEVEDYANDDSVWDVR